MRNFFRNVLVAAIILFGVGSTTFSTAKAAHSVTGPATIGGIVCNGSGQYCSFVLNTNRSNIPSCAGSDPTFIFQTNTEGGKSLLNLLLTSKVSGWSVTVYGTTTCATSTLSIPEEWVDYVSTSN